MIKILSKYNLQIPFTNPFNDEVCDFFTLNVYCYTGLKNNLSPPLVYSKTIKNPESLDTSINIDISNFVSEFVPDNSCCWVRTEVLYNNSSEAEFKSIKLASKGYSFSGEATNQNIEGILTSGLEHKIARNQTFVLKILAEETITPLGTLTITDVSETTAPLYDVTWSKTGSLIDIIMRYRLVGDSDWTLGFESFFTSPTNVELPTVAGDYEVQIFGFDTINSQNVYSNVYEITI